MKQKIRLILLLALLVELPSTAAADETNLVSNPSFERADAGDLLADDWTTQKGITVERNTEGGHTGQAFTRFRDDSSAKAQSLESLRIPVRPGGVYTASAWFRTSDTCRPGVYVNFYDRNGQRIEKHFERIEDSPQDWQRVVVEGTAPSAAWQVNLSIYAYTSDVGTFDADDAELTVTGGNEPRGDNERTEKSLYQIDQRRELFVDDFLVEKLVGSATQKMHHPQARQVAIKHDEPWEGNSCNYHTVFKDGDRYRMYYRASQFDLENGKLTEGHPQLTCYAESKDGIHWEKPNLGLCEFEGSTDNNIILDKGWTTHNFAPFKDTRPEVPQDEQYKALAYTPDKGPLNAYVSADGIRWRLLVEKPVITEGAFDSQNLAFWDAPRGEYRAYYRDFQNGIRTMRTAVSKDFVTWEGGDWVTYSDSPKTQLYTNQIQPYPRAPHLLIGLPTRYVDRGRTGSMKELPEAQHRELRASASRRYGTALTDLMLMSSRDGQNFYRWNDAFLRPGPERPGTWNYGQLYTACGLVRTAPTIEGEADELSLYAVEGHWTDASLSLRRYTLRIDGFASINATGDGGELQTRPVSFSGNKLVLNLATSAVGSIKVALQDIDHKEIKGFGIKDAEPIFGDTIEREVKWKGNPDLSKLAGRPVRIRFVLNEADIYSFQFE